MWFSPRQSMDQASGCVVVNPHTYVHTVISSLKAITDVDENSIKEYRTMNPHTTYSTTAEIKSQLYADYVNVDPPKLTGWGLYTIRKGFILGAAGNILTYVLVLYNIRDTSDASGNGTCTAKT